jgi:two-component system LytT family sensor kinase
VSETAALVSAQIELSTVEEQGERLARAELRALRAQISPHFVYNALAAVASFIHTRPDEARELLTEFAEFTRYAFRGQTPYVSLADELHYVQKYLRLEQARFGDRLNVRVEVAPEVLGAVVPVLSLQPLVENAVRHGVESRAEAAQVEIVGRDLGRDVELEVADDGRGMAPEALQAVLTAPGPGRPGGIGLSNVHSRLQQTFGEEYGLRLASEPGRGTTVTMTVPMFRAGVRAACAAWRSWPSTTSGPRSRTSRASFATTRACSIWRPSGPAPRSCSGWARSASTRSSSTCACPAWTASSWPA